LNILNIIVNIGVKSTKNINYVINQYNKFFQKKSLLWSVFEELQLLPTRSQSKYTIPIITPVFIQTILYVNINNKTHGCPMQMKTQEKTGKIPRRPIRTHIFFYLTANFASYVRSDLSTISLHGATCTWI